MEPSSGPPRPALQPLVDGDSVLGTTHLARFEFSDAGTKILMVEWMPEAKDAGTGETAQAPVPAAPEPAQTTSQSPSKTEGSDLLADAEGSVATDAQVSTATAGPNTRDAGAAVLGPESTAWQVSWPGKSTFLPARDMEVDGDEVPETPGANARRRIYFLLPVETPVPATVTITPPGRTPIKVEPLPAIFPESLMSSVSAGPRGVLHTIWAKKRLSELKREMDAEMRTNAESVGLEMAMAEKQWIESNFLQVSPPAVPVPTSPRSPISGRMAEKLNGLKLATSPADLVPSANIFTSGTSGLSQTLSPSGDDFAVSSFASITGGANAAAPISLNAAIAGDAAPPPNKPSADGDDDLFALPMSPRSPEMKKSPFSTL